MLPKNGKKNPSLPDYRYFNKLKPQIGEEEPCYRFICPTITALIFEKYDGSMTYLEAGWQLEAPRLRYLRYHGVLLVKGQLLLKVLGSSNVIQADLHIT